jgi:three-Cys-motif partner protein
MAAADGWRTGRAGRYNRVVGPAGGVHGTVKRELLVRLLDSAAPALVHGGFTYAEGYAGATAGQEPSAIAALRVFGEFADRLRGPVAVVLVGADRDLLDALSAQIVRLRAEIGLPATVRVDAVPGDCDDELVPALERADAFGAPIVGYLDATGAAAPGYDTLTRLSAGHHTDVLIVLDPAALTAAADQPDAGAGDRVFAPGAWRAAADLPAAGRYPYLVTCYRDTLGRAGLALVTHVELVDDDGYAQLLFFATASDKSLDRFKDELWAVDEFAGVRYRDPRDPDHALLDISLEPHLGPLRRALVDRVEAIGGCSAEELRRYTRTETIYRAQDAFRAIGGLVAAGRLSRDPQRGRLTADTVIRPGGSAR